MSFFKKLTKEFEGLKASLGGDEDKDKDKKQKDAHASDHRGKLAGHHSLFPSRANPS